VDYLLDAAHPDGGSKAVFFHRAGFRAANWELMAEALHNHAIENELAGGEETTYGRKFTIEAPLPTPDGRRPHVRSVWIILRGEEAPRFVSAYPLRLPRD